ncbi:hypothetical protein N2152v2_004008 [Parachlorella kessleri]
MAQPASEESQGTPSQANLSDVPDEVLATCFAQGLSSPRDVAFAQLVSHRFFQVARQAPLQLQLPHQGTASLDASGCPLEDADVALLAQGLTQLRVLLLSGCKKVTDRAITNNLLAAGLGLGSPGGLAAAGCDTGVNESQQHRQCRAQLRTLIMQRCFQLTARALTSALLAAVWQDSSVEGVALSHLDLRQWPDVALASVLVEQSRHSMGRQVGGAAGQAALVPAAGGCHTYAALDQQLGQLLLEAADQPAGGAALHRSIGGSRDLQEGGLCSLPGSLAALASTRPRGLRLLALHNCSGLTVGALRAVALACPALEALFLGGSCLALQEAAAGPPLLPGSSPASGADSDLAAERIQEQAEATAGEGSAGQGPASVGASSLTAGRGGRVELAPGRLLPDDFVDCSGIAHSVERARRAAAGTLGQLPLARWADPVVLSAAAELAAVASLLPRLRVMELTFGLPGLVPVLQDYAVLQQDPTLAADSHSCWRSRVTAVQFWDLCQAESVGQALAWRRECSAAAVRGAATVHDGSSVPHLQEVGLFLRAAVNCSSGAKVTPLHCAVEEGRCGVAQDLLRLGADVLARDRSGASPLFRACELGYVALAKLLLGTGAIATQRNSAGEAPLYIAALRGHEGVVRLLLEHCEAAGVAWENPGLYGDAWTPLMAAAVGGRRRIAQCLLEAAGPEMALGLVQATNRYGQTAVHIAARRGSFDLVQCLLEAGGGAAVAAIRDCNGMTAADVARRTGNMPAWELLHALTTSGDAGAANPPGEGGRGRRRRGKNVLLPLPALGPGSPRVGAASASTMPGGVAVPPPLPLSSLPAAEPPNLGAGRQWVGRRLGVRKSQASGAAREDA